MHFETAMLHDRINSWDERQDREWEALALVRASDRKFLFLMIAVQLVCTLALVGALTITWQRVERLESRVEALGGWGNE